MEGETLILLEAFGAVLLILGSVAVIRAVAVADRALSQSEAEAAEDVAPIYRRAA